MRITGQQIVAAALTMTCALAGLVITPSGASAQGGAAPSMDAHRIAVVDVAYIFKEHAGIKAQVAKIEKEVEAFKVEVNQRRTSLETLANQLKAFKAGSPEYSNAEEKVASQGSKLQLDIARKQKEFKEAEGRIYFDNYQRIAEAVKSLAQYYKIHLVLRYNSESMDMENGETVLRGLMKNVVYHDKSLDMTKGVMQYLDKYGSEVAGRPSGRR